MIRRVSALFLLFPILSFAAAPAWKIVPTESHLTFTATQNGAPANGEFKKFSGDIQFDPDQLNSSSVKIVIDIGSVYDSYNQLADTLKTTDWFNLKVFPQAIFQSKKISKIGDKAYQAEGMLTIRDKTLPVTLTFNQQEYSSTKAVMKGKTVIKRTAFGVGQGEWADTKAIKDDVQIDFIVSAIK